MESVRKPLATLACLLLLGSAVFLVRAATPQTSSMLGETSSLRSLSALSVSALSFFSAHSVASPAAQAAPDHAHFYLGFDRNTYPGDAALPVLRKSFTFASFWLSPPPGEKTNTWAGKRELLRSLGFGFLVLYRGPQISELQSVWSESRINRTDRHVYLRAWVDQIIGAGYHAGVYCSGMPVSEGRGATIITADDIRNNIGSRDLVYWVYNDACPPSPGCIVPQNPPPPSKSGIAYAQIWQFVRSPREKETAVHCSGYSKNGNCYAPGDTTHSWFLDLNTATSADPSGGAK